LATNRRWARSGSDAVVGAQLGDTPRMIEDLYGHGDVGALEEIDRAIGDNVGPLRRASGE
jgi:hypothetical protein